MHVEIYQEPNDEVRLSSKPGPFAALAVEVIPIAGDEIHIHGTEVVVTRRVFGFDTNEPTVSIWVTNEFEDDEDEDDEIEDEDEDEDEDEKD